MNQDQLLRIKQWLLGNARSIRAEEGAECCPILFLLNSKPNGNIGTCNAINLSHSDKDQWVAMQFKHSRDPSILCAILINEGWSTFVPLGEGIPSEETRAQDPTRQEVLLISLMTKDEQFLLTAEIHDNRIDDAEFIKVTPENFQGRFIREQQV